MKVKLEKAHPKGWFLIMKIIKQLITFFKTRNWFEFRLNPDELLVDEWYTVTMDIKRGKNGEQYYSDILLGLTNIKNVKVRKKALSKKSLVKYFNLNE